MISAACCRVMVLSRDAMGEVGPLDLRPLLAGDVPDGEKWQCLDRIKTCQALIRLPDAWEDWPQDAKVAGPHATWVPNLPFYTCKYLDRAKGRCMIYDQRPKMCRDYGHPVSKSLVPFRSQACNHRSCSHHRKDGHCGIHADATKRVG